MTLLATISGSAAEISIVAVWIRSLSSSALGAFFVVVDSRPVSPSSQDVARDDPGLGAVVPAYNEVGIIRRTVGQLVPALYPGCKIIVVDDGSTDGTAEAAASVPGHGEMKIIRLSKNCGKAVALNNGLKAVQSKFVVTIDADTTTDRRSIECALQAMEQTGADAVSFWIDVDRAQPGVLARLQSLEYATTMNFERAAQSVIGSISVIPGAATLYRAACLPTTAFSSRTSTEDADLTLRLSREGRHLVLCRSARASTLVPSTLNGLLKQRRRWTLGHLQCCILHFLETGGVRRFKHLTLANFILATLSPLIVLAAFLLMGCFGETPLLKLSVVSAFFISTVIVYLQRLVAFVLLKLPMTDVLYALVEPVFSGFIQAASFLLALAKLGSFTWVDRPHWDRLVWHK